MACAAGRHPPRACLTALCAMVARTRAPRRDGVRPMRARSPLLARRERSLLSSEGTYGARPTSRRRKSAPIARARRAQRARRYLSVGRVSTRSWLVGARGAMPALGSRRSGSRAASIAQRALHASRARRYRCSAQLGRSLRAASQRAHCASAARTKASGARRRAALALAVTTGAGSAAPLPARAARVRTRAST